VSPFLFIEIITLVVNPLVTSQNAGPFYTHKLAKYFFSVHEFNPLRQVLGGFTFNPLTQVLGPT